MRESVMSGASAPMGVNRWISRCALMVVAATAPSACILDLDTDTDGDRREITGSGHVVTESRTVSPFTRISVSGGGRIILQAADTEFVEVRADDNVLPVLATWVRNGTLFIQPDPDIRLRETSEIVFTVGYLQLHRIGISGAMEGEAFAIDTDFLSVSVSGASSLRTGGAAFDHDARISGASTYHASELETSTTVVTASGASAAVVWVLSELDASASGASRIRYRGDPSVRSSVSGAGSVRRY